MNFKNFTDEMKKQVQARLGEGKVVELRSVLKFNNVRLCGLTITEEGKNISPTIYLESFYEAYCRGASLSAIVDALVDSYLNVPLKESVDVSFFKNFEKVKGRIAYRLLNVEKNRELLADVPFIPYLDLAICFFYSFGDMAAGEGSILIRRSHMEMWNTDVRELFLLAQENTRKLFPVDLMRMQTLLEGMLGDEGKEMPDEMEQVNIYVLTNTKRVQGAAAMLYPDVLAELAGKLGSSFFIIPSSVHELILVPFRKDISVSALKNMIYEVNHTQLGPEDVLSDSLYAYDGNDKRIIKL